MSYEILEMMEEVSYRAKRAGVWDTYTILLEAEAWDVTTLRVRELSLLPAGKQAVAKGDSPQGSQALACRPPALRHHEARDTGSLG